MNGITYKNTITNIPGWVNDLHTRFGRGYAYESSTHFIHLYGYEIGFNTISIGLTAIQEKNGTLNEWVTNIFGAQNIQSLDIQIRHSVKGVWRPSLYYYEDTFQAKRQQSNLDRYQILQIYMAFGGIPHYLNNVGKGRSASQVIDKTCFSKDGLLNGEFNNLYGSLFEIADNHIKTVRALANTNRGLTRQEIIESCELSSGGRTTLMLNELEESGFIKSDSLNQPYHMIKLQMTLYIV